MHRLLRRPSPAMVVACVALFVASAGTSIAASHYLITSTKQIKPSVLKELKGARGPTGQSVIGDIGPQGPKGDTGTTGGIGPQGLKGDTGSQGLKGDTGSQGLKGDTGSQGPAGTEGEATASVAAYESTTSGQWTDLATPGPSVTVTVPASGNVLVILTAGLISDGPHQIAMGFSIDGVDRDIYSSLAIFGQANVLIMSSAAYVASTTPGSHTFKARYVSVQSDPAHFENRHITVIPLP